MIDQLRTDGWVEGRNIALEYRFDEGRRERLAALAAELVNLKVACGARIERAAETAAPS